LKGQVTYAVEGAIFVAGAAIQFLRDNLKLITTSAETEGMAKSVPDSGGVVFVPALTGLGAPYWDPHARGGIFGLTRGTLPAHIVRAALEAQAYQSRDLLEAMAADTGIAPQTLRIDGGLAKNNFVCSAVATQLGCVVERPISVETTAWGVAALTGLQSGLFGSLDDIANIWQCDARFEPEKTPVRDDGYAQWKNAVKRVMS
jgi:glycerol kinase